MKTGTNAPVVWRPQPRQREFMRRPEPEALYGGAAGGGKSDALIIEAFGLGGIPDQRPNTLSGVVDVWLDAGKSIVITTQVPEEGSDPTVYEVGRTFAQKGGVLLAGDMTTEAAFAKMMWVRAQTSDPARIRDLFYRPVQHDRTVG